MKTDWNIGAKSVENALGVLQAVCSETPEVALILGTGVNVLIDLVSPKVMPYEEVFGIAPTVAHNPGSITIGRLGSENGALVAVFRGRFYLYEGHDWSVCTLPARVLVRWGVRKILLANAARPVNTKLKEGDILAVTGFRDLQNPVLRETGLVDAVNNEPVSCKNALTDELLSTAEKLRKEDPSFPVLHAGVYAASLGPSLETPAELEMLRRVKCDAVGMSTVPELETVGMDPQHSTVACISLICKDLPTANQLPQLDKLLRAALGS